MKIQGIEPEVMQEVLAYIYSGKVETSDVDILKGMYLAANMLQVSSHFLQQSKAVTSLVFPDVRSRTHHSSEAGQSLHHGQLPGPLLLRPNLL